MQVGDMIDAHGHIRVWESFELHLPLVNQRSVDKLCANTHIPMILATLATKWIEIFVGKGLVEISSIVWKVELETKEQRQQ